ncbi:transmembrane protein, putative [Medicago truncatula]|uniref:Transmembrane protein, putative n=1 Tax=Medicago truncatula TaxID=3880 RepID=G7LBW5_MEDTR|nr:transmembrane protein, putative [Medicago truncatula]
MSFFFFSLFSLLLLFPLSFVSFTLGATLQEDEVEALKDIGKTLGKKDWDFSVDPCSGRNNWISSTQLHGSENAVTCNCSFQNNTLCHVVSVYAYSSSFIYFFFFLMFLAVYNSTRDR